MRCSRYAELRIASRLGDGYSMDLRIATVLRGLGFEPEDSERQCETFSGGWQMRIALAKLLLGRPNLLLLDEPTNHLDLEARNWLEEYLGAYPCAVILVSHDRYFLDSVVTRITDVHLRKLTDYVGNYSKTSSFATRCSSGSVRPSANRTRSRARQDVHRSVPLSGDESGAGAEPHQAEKVVPIEVPPERKRIHFRFPDCMKSGRRARAEARAQGLRSTHGLPRRVAAHRAGDRIALVGPNGTGKSTRCACCPEKRRRTRHADVGHQVVMEYFAQDEATRLDPTLTVYETLSSGSPNDMVPAIRNILGGFLFSGDDVYKKAGVLSGGERTRLAVARMLLRPSNTLLLDEPTNHLDLDSKDVLLDALEDYGGTLIIVSHDRYFVEKLATKIIEIGWRRPPSIRGHTQNFSGISRGAGIGIRNQGRGEGGKARSNP